MSKPICIGHRGARGYRPENTLSSFEHAIVLGCPWVELDVYAVGSELIVIHDKTVDRTTNGSGLISEMTFEELRSLDAGDGQQIPTLDEVVALIDGRCSINVELKGADTAGPVNSALERYCGDGWAADQFLVSSFNHRELAKSDRTYRRGALFHKLTDDWLDQALDLNAWSANFDYRDVDSELVNMAQKAGLKALVYTVNEPQDIRRMFDAGVDGIFSDYPDRVLAVD
jgi:glycerophosphoryl diester phosphodiesterase